MIRKAKLHDVPRIKKLLGFYSSRGLLLDRPLAKIHQGLRDFFVAENDSELLGCCSLHLCWDNLGEIRSLAVKEENKGTGIGKALVEACLKEAKELELKKVFTLTYVPDFFKKLGFEEVDKKELPQTVWAECVNCVKFPDCDENALIIEL